MKGLWGAIVRNPVAFLGGASAVLATADSVATAQHLLGTRTLSWVSLVEAVLVTLGTVAAHRASTSLANPKDANGEPLVAAVRPQDATQ